MVQCLKNASFSSTFQAFCDQGTEVLKICGTDDDTDIEAIENDVLKSLTVIGRSPNVDAEIDLQACIAAYPNDAFGLPIGHMQAYLDRQAMNSLGKDQEIQDDVIRAILGLEWGSQGKSSITFYRRSCVQRPTLRHDGR